MGQGLGLNHKTAGLHLAFAAGTGVLTFFDLVARIRLNQFFDEKNRLSDGFRFRLYVTSKPDEHIHKSVVEGVQEHVGKDRFEIIYRKKGDPRWDKKFVEKCLKGNDVQKIYICGTPVMKNQFKYDLLSLCADLDMDFESQVLFM